MNPFKRLQDLHGMLHGMLDRVEVLETAPTPELDLDPIRDELRRIKMDVGREASRVDQLESAVENLESRSKTFTIALAEGIERVDRSERRIKATVTRARKELGERGLRDPGLEAESFELFPEHGEGGGGGEMSPVPEQVDPALPKASSIRGVPLATLHRVRKFQ